MEGKILNFGILSTANIAKKVILAIKDTKGADVFAVASRNLEKAQKYAYEHQIPNAYGSYQELVDCKEINAVYIPLPTSMKAEWAIKCAQAKKHVLVEKPLPGYNNDQELKQLIQACKDNQVQFLDGTMWVHSNRAKIIEEKLKNKELGEIKSVHSQMTFTVQDPKWLEGGDIRTQPDLEPQGLLGDVGWYTIMSTLYAYNFELPLSINLVNYEKNSKGMILSGHGNLKYPNNSYATIEFSCLMPARSTVEIVGVNGVIIVEDLGGGQGRTGNLDAYFNKFTGSSYYKVLDSLGKESRIECEPCDMVVKMIEQLRDLINTDDKSYKWAERSWKCQYLLTLLIQSMEQGKEIIL